MSVLPVFDGRGRSAQPVQQKRTLARSLLAPFSFFAVFQVPFIQT
jgi:hypothetical protein